MRQRWRADFAWTRARRLVGTLAIIGLAGCGQPGVSHDWANSPRTAEDAYARQVDIDALAIVAGMALAHGGRMVALMPAEPKPTP
jgi:hypothetical protein